MLRSTLAVGCVLAATAVAGCSTGRDGGSELDVLVPPSSSKSQGKQQGKNKMELEPKEVAWRVGIMHEDLPSFFADNRAANGDTLSGKATLVWCTASYPSEKLRIARDQVLFPGPGLSIYDAVSSEVVVYRRGGAAQAMKEMRTAISNCPSTRVLPAVGGGGVVHAAISMLPRARGWRDNAYAFAVTLSGDFSWSGAIVYQVKGDVLAAVTVTSQYRALLGRLGAVVNRRLEKYAGQVDGEKVPKATKSARPV
jgi:hypothetical protein